MSSAGFSLWVLVLARFNPRKLTRLWNKYLFVIPRSPRRPRDLLFAHEQRKKQIRRRFAPRNDSLIECFNMPLKLGTSVADVFLALSHIVQSGEKHHVEKQNVSKRSPRLYDGENEPGVVCTRLAGKGEQNGG